MCEDAGADGITAHLREDRRHIQDDDIHRLAATVRTVLNLEMACTLEMLDIAIAIRPHQVTLVPERREEVTTEGGLDVTRSPRELAAGVRRLVDAGIRTSLFIDPTSEAVRASQHHGAHAVEFHTGQYAHHPDQPMTLRALADASTEASGLGLFVHAGHGLTVDNVGPVASIPEIEELNIGHAIVARAIMIGMPAAVREMQAAMQHARASLVR